MCLSALLRKVMNWCLTRSVGRGHDPADPLRVSDRLVERKMARSYRRAYGSPPPKRNDFLAIPLNDPRA